MPPVELVDAAVSWSLLSSTTMASGAMMSFVQDTFVAPEGDQMTREYVAHPGAVGVIALDEHNRVALVRQYRHPVRHRLVEPPAGLLDIDGEDALAGAARELAEEVHLAATDWRVLVDLFTSPGMSSEGLRIYLARGLTEITPPDGFTRHGEEAEMDTAWAELDHLLDAVLAGRLHNPILVSGVLATWTAARRTGLDALRPAHATWPARQVLESTKPLTAAVPDGPGETG